MQGALAMVFVADKHGEHCQHPLVIVSVELVVAQTTLEEKANCDLKGGSRSWSTVCSRENPSRKAVQSVFVEEPLMLSPLHVLQVSES